MSRMRGVEVLIGARCNLPPFCTVKIQCWGFERQSGRLFNRESHGGTYLLVQALDLGLVVGSYDTVRDQSGRFVCADWHLPAEEKTDMK